MYVVIVVDVFGIFVEILCKSDYSPLMEFDGSFILISNHKMTKLAQRPYIFYCHIIKMIGMNGVYIEFHILCMHVRMFISF